ncbi:hypothetical protein [Dongia sp.]|uniref:hypothetical protein n=1 Tax=Dongia sp. TaxID=1977262 RepID=UPI0035AFD7E3
MATKPVFAATPRQGQGTISTAETSFSAPTNVATIFTAGASGSRIERVRVCATGTTAAGIVNLWLHDGTNYRLVRSVLQSAITASTTVAPWGTDGAGFVYFEGGLILPTGWSLRASTTIAQGFHITADGADF